MCVRTQERGEREGGEAQREKLTFAMTFISDGNGATRAAGGKSQVAGTLVGVSVGSADGAYADDLVRECLRAPAGAPHTMRT